MNFKRSILSLAAVLALNSTVTADPNATYVPLTSKEFDKAWIMFGVNDFSTGIPTPAASDSDFSTGYSVVEEASTSDDLVSPSQAVIDAGVDNTTFASSTGENMATFQALKDANGAPLITDTLNLALKTTDVVYSEQQPIRSMYIAIQTSPTDTNTVAKIKLNYRSSLEGRTVEIQLNNEGTVYKTTISERATFNSPAIAKEIIDDQVELDEMAPEDVLAYDLTNSPVLASAYDKNKYQGDSTGAERFYHYDAVNAQWVLWDRLKVSDGTNTLTKLKRGKAYWGRMDINSDGTTTSTTKAGLYLGKSGKKEADPAIYTGDLVPNAWNMVAFDPAENPDMRNAATGLIVSLDADFAANDSIELLDETGTNSVTVTFDADLPDSNASKYINAAIEADKIAGKIPDTFNIKAFDVEDGNNTIIFLSDKQFTVKDMANDNLKAVKTLAGAAEVIISDGTKQTVDDINDSGVTSVYGEYAMIIEPLTGSDTASNLDGAVSGTDGDSDASAAIAFGNIDGDSESGVVPLADDDTNTTLQTATDKIVTDDIFNGTKTAIDGTTQSGNVVKIDTNFDGVADMVLTSANKAFYVKDNTFTRVYTVDTTATGLGGGLKPFAITPYITPNIFVTPAGTAVSDVETAINDVADENATDTDKRSTGIYADIDPNDATKLVIVTKNSKVLELLDVDSATIDYFSAASSTSDIAKGAVKRVINIAELARESVITNRLTISFADDGSTDDGVVSIDVNSIAGDDVNVTTADDTEIIAMLDKLVDNTNQILKDNNISAFASHNYLDTTNDITKATISIEGIGITSTSTDTNDSDLIATDEGEQNSNPGELNVDSALIIADLKANAIYTPDYVNNGPLYTLKKAGYEAKVIIRPSTKLDENVTTHWDHIDLTRNSKDWLKNNEFNLFNVSNSAGYWVFVDAYTPQNDIAESNLVWSPSFSHHFNTATGATENLLNSATFSIEIADGSAEGGVLDEETSNAKLLIGGNEVQLTKTGSTFSAVLTQPETSGFTPNTGPISISLLAADGLGESYLKSDLISFDYDKPEKPTVNFLDGINVAFTSADATSFYLWKDYVPDDGSSNTPTESNLLAADAASYNVCKNTNYGDTTSYQVVAFDGTGIFGKANASDINGFTYENTLKGATVLTHTNGDDTSIVASYSATDCTPDAAPLKSGVEVKAVQSGGSVVLSYIALEGTVNNEDDLPFSAFYEITDGSDDVLQVDVLKAYAGKPFYVEFNNGALYKGNFPVDQTEADNSFDNALDLTLVSSKNSSLD